MASDRWQYTINREILLPEEFGWMPHCVPYRERNRFLSRGYSYSYNQAGQNVSQFREASYTRKTEYMIDRNNSDRRNNPDNGGNLTYYKREDIRDLREFDIRRISTGPAYRYIGPLIPDLQVTDTVTGNSEPSAITENVLIARGATLVASALPTAPASGVGQFLAELKQGLPRATLAILRSLKGLPRNAADDFLNYQFGWKPLVRDLLQFVQVLKNKNELIRQWHRDSGRQVRRRRSLQPTVTRSIKPGRINVIPTNADLNLKIWGYGSVEQVDETFYSFSGAFIYDIGARDDLLSTLDYYERLGDRLFGVALTPELLWEIAPWSWLVDWFTNVGDVMSNITAFNQHGVVMPYGYVMATVRRRYVFRVDTWDYSGTTWTSPTDRWPQPLQRERLYEWRYRRKANPYGFGMTWDGLSSTQLAILAALGLSRGKRDD